MNFTIREIQAQETYDLRHQVMWPDKPIEFIKLPNDEEGIHIGLTKDSEMISIVSLFIKGNRAQFRKFATKTSEQGKGYGTRLLDHLLTIACNEKIETIWCNARVDKISFYERVGMIQTPHRFTKEGVSYVIMEKTITKNG